MLSKMHANYTAVDSMDVHSLSIFKRRRHFQQLISSLPCTPGDERDTKRTPPTDISPVSSRHWKVYEGSWKASKRHGYGEQRYGVGTKWTSSYAGDWEGNCRDGQGTMTYASGNVYEGGWVKVGA